MPAIRPPHHRLFLTSVVGVSRAPLFRQSRVALPSSSPPRSPGAHPPPVIGIAVSGLFLEHRHHAARRSGVWCPYPVAIRRVWHCPGTFGPWTLRQPRPGVRRAVCTSSSMELDRGPSLSEGALNGGWMAGGASSAHRSGRVIGIGSPSNVASPIFVYCSSPATVDMVASAGTRLAAR